MGAILKLQVDCFREEADEYIDIGALNGIFVLGRSMGFIGELLVVIKYFCLSVLPHASAMPFNLCGEILSDVTLPSSLFLILPF